MALVHNTHGKGRVRVLRLRRRDDRQDVSELTLKVMLEGGFGASYTRADNAAVVATDSIKNLVHVVAHENKAAETEPFCAAVADRLLGQYPQVRRVAVAARETRWVRLDLDGAPHPHGFVLDGNGHATAAVTATREGVAIRSGVEGLTFMKSTGSGWSGYVRDGFTTLPETRERVCGTSMHASWEWSSAPSGYAAANAALVAAMLRVFVETYSESLQDSLYRMGLAGLEAVPQAAQVTMACPNKHYVPVNLAPFGLENDGTVLVPTDEPHGQIECTVDRS